MQRHAAILILALAMLFSGCDAIQRQFLFFPSHHTQDNGLTAWIREGKVIGYSRQVSNPRTVWLMLHGNGGQAADRTYAMPCFSPQDSVYVMEYPGYGVREGKPSKASFDAAALEAYQLLRSQFPATPVCVVGESLGSGPSCLLAKQSQPPDKIVLIVPFDELSRLAAKHFPFLPVRLILGSTWNNMDALSTYKGPVEVFGAKDDTIIPVEHARALAASLPSAKFHLMACGHNEWSQLGKVEIRNP